MSSKQKLIMLPGPTNVSEKVMQAMLQPVINHRGDSFRALYKGVLEKSKRLFQTEQDVVIFSSSGTGAVEASVWNLIRPGDAAIVPVFGEFSARLGETVGLAGGKAVEVKAEPGNAPSLKQLEEAMDRQGSFKALFLVHNETSTGVVFPHVEELTRIAREHGAFVVVDAISSLGGYAIPVDRWGVDICVTGSQKCIAAPPGLSLISASERVVKFTKESPPHTRYFDIPRYLEYGSRGETPFTPALPIYYALDEALKALLEEGLANVVMRHERESERLYQGLESLGLGLVASKDVRSRTVAAAYYPPGIDDAQFRRSMSQDLDIVIAGGFGPFSGKVFRVGCMGLINEGFVKRTVEGIGQTLKKFSKP